MTPAAPTTSAVTAAARLFDAYRDAIGRLQSGLDANFENAVQMMLDTTGHVVVCGMGKSGLIGAETTVLTGNNRTDQQGREGIQAFQLVVPLGIHGTDRPIVSVVESDRPLHPSQTTPHRHAEVGNH